MALWAAFEAFPARNRLSARHDSTIHCVSMGPPIRCREVPPHRSLKAAIGLGTRMKAGVRDASSVTIISEASSRDLFVFLTLRQPRCIEWMALVDLMVTL